MTDAEIIAKYQAKFPQRSVTLAGPRRTEAFGLVIDVLVDGFGIVDTVSATDPSDWLAQRMNAKPNPACACSKCNPDEWGLVVCSVCGNKRCPHATDHNLACTNSNEPGQTGSVFA